MTLWETVCTWGSGFVLIVGALLVLAGCPGPGGEECGGIDDIVSCISITSIVPTSTAGGDSSDVDAFLNACTDGSTEPFTKHVATFTFSNSAFPGSSDNGLPVTIRSVSITYELNTIPCPGTACPPLSAVQQNETLAIPAGGLATKDFPLVPIQTKLDYVAAGGDPSAAPSYMANYVFTAQTDFFNDTITIRGSVPFVIGNFDLCP